MGQRVTVAARGTAAAGALVDVLQAKRSEQLELAKERREFERRLQTTLLEKGYLVPEIDPMTGAVTLKPKAPETAEEMMVRAQSMGLEPSDMNAGGQVSFGRPGTDRLPSQQDLFRQQALGLGAQAEGMLPPSDELLAQAIAGQQQPDRSFALEAPGAPGQLFDPQQQAQQLARSRFQQMQTLGQAVGYLPRPAAAASDISDLVGDSATAPNATSDPIVERVQQLRQRGMSDAQIAAFLRQKGLDPSAYGL